MLCIRNPKKVYHFVCGHHVVLCFPHCVGVGVGVGLGASIYIYNFVYGCNNMGTISVSLTILVHRTHLVAIQPSTQTTMTSQQTTMKLKANYFQQKVRKTNEIL